MNSLFPCVAIVLLTLFGCSNTISTDPHGIGPIKKLDLKPINDSLMQAGQHLFQEKCSQCHTMEFKNTGPEISDLLAYRKPEWLANFLLNKHEMLEKDSLAISTRLMYNDDCGADITNKNDALEILEYFRIYQIWLHEFNTNNH